MRPASRSSSVVVALILGALLIATACTTPSSENGGANDDFSGLEQASSGSSPEASIESEIAGDQGTSQPPPAAAQTTDEFSEFDQPPAAAADPAAPPPADPMAAGPEIELQSTEPAPPAEAPAPFVDPGASPEAPPIAEAPQPITPPEDNAAPAPTGQTVTLNTIEYRANDGGGTVVVEATGPMTYTTRTNEKTHQFVVEIPESKLPKKLQRPLNTRDIAGSIGAIDAYQTKGSSTSRIVLQLREGATEPVVQVEGNSLLIVAQGALTPLAHQNAPTVEAAPEENEEPLAPAEGQANASIMSFDSLEQFLATNQQFYGKRISFEVDETELKDVFKFIGDEANVNLVLSGELKGKVSVKLKNVPWDQAVVTLMKANKLGFTRVGNVIRIAPQKEIKEEEDAVLERKQRGPQKVKTIAINYSKVEDMEKQIKTVLSPKGAIVGDSRTSTLVISDFDENIVKATQLVQALDIPPAQVLIEGKIVEASEDFENQVGFQWSATGRPSGSGTRSRLGFDLSPGFTKSAGKFNFRIGTFDILGDLTATLALYENQGIVNILSSPRIVTLHNEAADINQKIQVPTTTVTDVPGVGQRQAVQYIDLKLRLFVKPQVTNDGSVIMDVDVNRDIQGPVPSGSTTGAPRVDSKGAKSKVLVRNGQTAVIGGIYQNDQADSDTKIPGIADVPIIGWLFKSSTKTTHRNELLIFLTPRILAQVDGQTIPNNSGFGSGAGGL